MMSAALLAVRLVLTAVFLVAGAAKLADRPGSRKAMLDFGLPPALAAPAGLGLPIVEIGIAILLLPAPSARLGALSAFLLLLIFIAGMGVNLARGRTPDCHCFGQLHSEPVGRDSVLRNTGLAILAAFVAVVGWKGAGPGAFDWLAPLSATERVWVVLAAAAIAALVVQAWFLFRLVEQTGLLLARLKPGADDPRPASDQTEPHHEHHEHLGHEEYGLPAGSPAPAFSLGTLDGDTMTLDELRGAGKPVMLFFTDPNCVPCNALMPEIARWQREHAEHLTMAIVSRGTAKANRTKADEHGLRNVLLQREHEVEDAYRVPGTPGAVAIYAEGIVGSPVAAGSDAVHGLLRQLMGLVLTPAVALLPQISRDDRVTARVIPEPVDPVLEIGKPAPDVGFIDLTGHAVGLDQFRGRDTLVLLWDTGCGFCQQMLPELKSWEEHPPEGAPQLLVVVPGDSGQLQAVTFRSPVVIDRDSSASYALGLDGTPTALLIDADGNVASEVVVGAQAVFDLANGRQGHGERASA